jgi:glutathione peroxidase-family protein
MLRNHRESTKTIQGGKMISEKRWIVIIVFFLTLSLFLVSACSEKSSQEKMAEKALKQATGKDVDVKMQGGKIQIEEKGSKTEIADTTTWPPELIKDVPKFTAGKIKRVVKTHEEGSMWTFNIYLVDINGDDIKNYAGALKEKGWKTDIIQMGDKGGSLNGEKGTMGINFMYSLERKDGMLAIFNRP